MPRIKEPLDGGLVTISDPAVLGPGQLSDAHNCLYLPGQGALQRNRGRSSFGVVSASAVDVVGLRDIQFDNSDHYLIALASATLFKSVVGNAGAGSFSSLATLSAIGGSLEAVQYQNRFFLFPGVQTAVDALNSNVVAYLSATAAGSTVSTRQHGMLPVDSAPTVVTAGAGSFSQTITGYYEYWTTEVAKLTQDGAELVLESAYSAKNGPTTVLVSATTVVPTIYMPNVVNPGFTTHWRVYRSPKKTFQTDKMFPAGFMVGESSTATGYIADSPSGSLTSFVNPSAANSGSQPYTVASAQASAMFTVGGGNRCEIVSGVIATAGSPNKAGQSVYNFNLGGFAGTIAGIEVEMIAYATGFPGGFGGMPFRVTIGSKRDGTGQYQARSGAATNGVVPVSKSGICTATAPGAMQTIILGSGSDPWVGANTQNFVDSDFDANFMAVIAVSQPGSLFVDSIRVRVTYGAISTTVGVIPFPSVVYEFGGVSAQVARDHPPPSCNTGDVYQDSLVVNDLNNPSMLKYSYPGQLESFPPTYFIDFETRENDRVRCVKTVNNRLVVWLDASCYRVNYLPSERDASFDRGKAFDPISTNFGAVNPMCVTTFSMDGGPEMAAFVSNHGLHATDGFSFVTYSDGLDWRKIISISGTSTPIALIDDKERRQLLFYFRNDVDFGAETYLCLPFCYHAAHLRSAQNFGPAHPKCGGVQHMRNFDVGSSNFGDLKSAWVSPRTNGDQSVYLGYGGATAAGAGSVYIENGTSIPASDPTMQYTTRRLYLAESGSEWKCSEIYGYALGYDGTQPTLNYTLKTVKTNDTGEISTSAKAITLKGQFLHKAGMFQKMCEGARITMQATASGFAQEYLLIDYTSYGLEDSGR
jgi:hypothetical protein